MGKQLTQFQALPGADAIDFDAGIIRNVSVMTIGPALGHGITIDRKGLEQCLAACQQHGEEGVKLVMNHDSGFPEIVGAVKNFRIEVDKLLGDAYLLEHSPDRARILELAQKMPSNFGLSVETTGKHEQAPGQKTKLYRCADIQAIALVPKPAANPSGLFSQVDNSIHSMDEETKQFIVDAVKETVVESVGAAVAEAVDPIKEEVSSMSARLAKLEEGGGGPKTDEDKKDEDQLAAIVDKALQKFAAKIGLGKAPFATPDNGKKFGITKFEQKVEEFAKQGARDPFFKAATAHPDLYAEYREKKERGQLNR